MFTATARKGIEKSWCYVELASKRGMTGSRCSEIPLRACRRSTCAVFHYQSKIFEETNMNNRLLRKISLFAVPVALIAGIAGASIAQPGPDLSPKKCYKLVLTPV